MTTIMILAAITVVLAALAGILIARAKLVRVSSWQGALPIWALLCIMVSSISLIGVAVNANPLAALSLIVLSIAIAVLFYCRIMRKHRLCDHDWEPLGKPVACAPGVTAQKLRCRKCGQFDEAEY